MTMTMNKQEQWREEFEAYVNSLPEDQQEKIGIYADEIYLAACKKRDEEQRLENEKALEAFNFIGRKCETRFSAFDDELWDKFETIKSALESV